MKPRAPEAVPADRIPLEDRIDEIRSEFPATSRMGYLNTGTVAPIPKSVLERHQDLERRLHFGGPLDAGLNAEVRERFQAVRPVVASFLGTVQERIALTANTTDGINAALLSRDWSPGDEVITSDEEHPAVIIPLHYLEQRYGVVTRRIPVRGGALRAEDVQDAIGPRCRAVVVSHVSFTTGGAYPADEICRVARERGLLTVLDGAQSVGAIAVHPDEIGCDFYAFPAYKWTCGPQGAGALYAAERVFSVTPYRVAMHAVSGRLPEGGYTLYDDARRFEGTATMAQLDLITWGAALEYLTSLGLESVTARVRALCRRFKEGLAAASGVELVTPLAGDESAGLVTFRVDGLEAAGVTDALKAQGLIVRSVPGGRVRASFHFYNTVEEVDRLLGAVRALAG